MRCFLFEKFYVTDIFVRIVWIKYSNKGLSRLVFVIIFKKSLIFTRNDVC